MSSILHLILMALAATCLLLAALEIKWRINFLALGLLLWLLAGEVH